MRWMARCLVVNAYGCLAGCQDTRLDERMPSEMARMPRHGIATNMAYGMSECPDCITLYDAHGMWDDSRFPGSIIIIIIRTPGGMTGCQMRCHYH